jgi:lipopolysaccharide transport system ATP-binding protein
MSKEEIRRRFDEIVDFAGVEKFLDTPVKRYSSGMRVRLGFSVAAHLEPEILIVDEVLAVGDAQFQKKCLGKMEEVGKEGRTVLLVSHQMEAIANLCAKAILLESGQISQSGQSDEVISHYLDSFLTKKRPSLNLRGDRSGDGRIQFTDVWTENKFGDKTESFYSGESFKVILKYEVRDSLVSIKDLKVSLSIFSSKNSSICLLSNYFTGDYFIDTIPTEGVVKCVIRKLPLNFGTYYFNVSIHSLGGLEDWVQDAGIFEIIGGDFYGTGRMPDRERMILIDHEWELLQKGQEVKG